MQFRFEFPDHLDYQLTSAAERNRFMHILGVSYYNFSNNARRLTYANTQPSATQRYCEAVHKLAAQIGDHGDANLQIAHNLLCHRQDLIMVFYLRMETPEDVEDCKKYAFGKA